MPHKAKRPNVLIITCHDIGRHLGCYGVRTVQTPNLDRLAAEGVRFERCFASAPTCSPSRASIFTGRYAHSTGVLGLCHGDFAWDMDRGETHLAAHLAAAGYRTELVGVMHETHEPEGWGYERVLAFDDVYRPDCDEIAREAAERLGAAARADAPWFLHVGFFEPHSPFDFGGAGPDDSRGVSVPPWLVDEPSARREFACYQGAIRKVDAAIGRLLEALRASGTDGDTIVLFTADHGIPFPRAKASLYDPGLAVALLVRWPRAGWTGGKPVDALVGNIDITPTLLEAAGLTVPGRVHGRSLLPLLDGRPWTPREAVFAEQNYHGGGWFLDPRRAVRTERHKLIANFTTDIPFENRPAVRVVEPVSSRYMAMLPHGTMPPFELYDLEADPLEFENLAASPDQAQPLQDLKSRLYRWMVATGDPLLEGFPVPPAYQRTLQALKNTGAE